MKVIVLCATFQLRSDLCDVVIGLEEVFGPACSQGEAGSGLLETIRGGEAKGVHRTGARDGAGSLCYGRALRRTSTFRHPLVWNREHALGVQYLRPRQKLLGRPVALRCRAEDVPIGTPGTSLSLHGVPSAKSCNIQNFPISRDKILAVARPDGKPLYPQDLARRFHVWHGIIGDSNNVE